MKYILYLAVILIVYFGFYAVRIFYFSYYSPLAQINPKDTVLGQGQTLKYIAAGDSTAVGVGASSFQTSYSYKLAEHFSKNSKVEYTNVALSGARTTNVMNTQLDKIIEFNPDVVTISIGANDVTHLTSTKTVINNFKQIISEIESKTHAKIYLTNIPNFTGAKLLPFWYIDILENKSKKINEQLAGLESERVHIVNIHDFGWDKFPDLSVTYAADNFHPNDIGYQNWTNAFLNRLK